MIEGINGYNVEDNLSTLVEGDLILDDPRCTASTDALSTISAPRSPHS